MSVQISQVYQFTDNTSFDPRKLQWELNGIAAAINSANAGTLTWDNIKATTAVLTTATITNLTYGGVWPIANGGTNSATSLANNCVIKSSGGKLVEATAITASRALASDANGIPVASATTAAELAFVNGVTSAIQTQINALTAKYFQTVQGTTATATTTTSTIYVDTAITAAITPASASHRVKVTVSTTGKVATGTETILYGLKRGSDLFASGLARVTPSTNGEVVNVSFCYIDSPATTGATTYTVRCLSLTGSSITDTPSSVTSTIILEEIA